MVFKVFLLGLLFSAPIYASHETQKQYINSDNVCVADGKIFVMVKDQWMATPSLHSDAHGIYVDEIKLLPWQCGNCGRWTTGWFCCEHCGAPN